MQCLSNLLAMLRAAQASHHHGHWVTKGSTFYGDHLLFEKLYTAIEEEIDSLAEKAVQQFGDKTVELVPQFEDITACLQKWTEEGDLFKRALLVEKTLQVAIEDYRQELKDSGYLSIGLDNFLAQLADSHETALYLLGQRVKG